MRAGVDRLKRRIADLEAFDTNSIARAYDPRITALEKSIDETLQRVFGARTIELSRYRDAAKLHQDWGVASLYSSKGQEAPASELQQEFSRLKDKSHALLSQAVNGLEEDIAERASAPVRAFSTAPQKALQRKVFIVHGHEGEPREAVAGFLRKIDFTPVILHEQTNQGRTIVEKFEDHSDVDFAVVLLTPDDVGGPKGEAQRPRARQNVILELGYFIGKLSRKNVCVIKSGDLEIPSDVFGVVWTDFDSHGAWKAALARELESAGHAIDWNKAMRP
jgi:predicted nucleotide-binding protein